MRLIITTEDILFVLFIAVVLTVGIIRFANINLKIKILKKAGFRQVYDHPNAFGNGDFYRWENDSGKVIYENSLPAMSIKKLKEYVH